MGFFKDLFKSKARKEADALREQWRNLLKTAVQQLKSSKRNYDQIKHFINLMSGRDVRNWIPRLQILVDGKLSDGSPILSKFFLRPVAVSSIKCRIAIHDSSILDSIKEIGFEIVSLRGAEPLCTDLDLQAGKGLSMMEFCDNWDMAKIVEKCNQYYDALLNVKDRITSREVICVPRYTKIEWNGSSFSYETELTPSRVDEIIASLPSDCKYLLEYREFLIEKLAEASISTSSVGVRKLKKIAYNEPAVYCWIYSEFEKRHQQELDYQVKNKEFESVINEIRDVAQKKIETEIGWLKDL
jgi:hypothetical protein